MMNKVYINDLKKYASEMIEKSLNKSISIEAVSKLNIILSTINNLDKLNIHSDVEHVDFSGLEKYKQKHGLHFTKDLAEWASKKMKNRDGSSHYWSAKEVATAMARKGMALSHNNMYDAQYIANMAYADYYSPDGQSALKSDADIVQFVIDTINDPDAADGQIFNRWLADTMLHKQRFDWESFM